MLTLKKDGADYARMLTKVPGVYIWHEGWPERHIPRTERPVKFYPARFPYRPLHKWTTFPPVLLASLITR